MRRIIRFCLVCLVFAAFVLPLYAETPEELALAYFDKLKTGGIGSVGELMHPDELRKFHEMFAPVVEDSLAHDEEQVFQKFADHADPKKMRQLTDIEFMNLFMDWIVFVQPLYSEALKYTTVEALGHVPEGDVKHVLVRMRMKKEDFESETMSVFSVKDFNGVTKMMLTGEIKGLAETMKRQREQFIQEKNAAAL